MGKYVVNHKDGGKQNNQLNNLEWVKIPMDISDGSGFTNKRRTLREIQEYENEAFDKAWLTHTRPVEDPDIEDARKQNIARILETYHDIPADGYSDWECGYWNGIMSALRWVTGGVKDFLDT